ncbi:hypothetical protein ELUMI_v1c06190 [Williamsoniiplasma luminosum]|uniref:DUF896 domain-containing protein n=1 Tax=Williamsoniiplasma luminosum TaxID=214888 RepID=A0A2K8NX69_9MOLU|nr:DUF896 domain-containing protein [Williamsoniiplasma luminosum]ATZ17341.1 hypothetical protein ELUMI_v1c06190 [Williamsoniiplasma luminosum]
MKKNEKVEAMQMDELIVKINEFAQLAKTRELNDEEKELRELLRNKYISIFRQGVKQQLENIKIVDEQGNEITKKKDGKNEK